MAQGNTGPDTKGESPGALTAEEAGLAFEKVQAFSINRGNGITII